MLNLKTLIEKLIWKCAILDITKTSANAGLLFFNRKLIKENQNLYLPTHYVLNDKLVYVNGNEEFWFNLHTNKLKIATKNFIIIEIDLTTSMTRIKLQALREEIMFSNSILKLCHTGK